MPSFLAEPFYWLGAGPASAAVEGRRGGPAGFQPTGPDEALRRAESK
jgi:hypothetical protein